MVIELVYFTLLETLAAVFFIGGLAGRLAAVWAVIEFAKYSPSGRVHSLLSNASV
jgi:hypothetical protein